jgi:acyl carrier protein
MMDRAALLQALKEMIEEDRDEPIDNLDEGVSLREGLGLDSVDLLTIVMQVQERFKIVLDSSELEKVVTVRDFVNLMQARLAGAPQAA